MHERLNQLGTQFLQRTAREVSSLRELLVQARSGDARALEQLEHLAHKIHGTGATLGFLSISECGGELERLLREQTAVGAIPDPLLIERLAESVARLESEVERLVKNSAIHPN